MSKIAVAILNFNGCHYLKQFLPSVINNTDDADVVVIDNGSTDASVNWLRDNHPNVRIIQLEKNYGFCGGYNRGISRLNHDLVVLLNSDVMVTAGWLPPLAHQFATNADLAACQPKILSYNQPNMFEYAGAGGGYIDWLGYPFCRGRIFDRLENDQQQYDDTQDIFWASGACMMVKRSAFIEAGGFEERFFAHMEEIDLCWRWLHRGLKIKYCPQSIVYHLGAGTLQKSNPRKTFLNFRNGLCMLYRNYTDKHLLSTIMLRLLLDGVAGIQFLLQGKFRQLFAIIQAHFNFYATIPYWRATRRLIMQQRKNTVQYPILQSSVVWQFFIQKRKTFAELKGVEKLNSKP